MASEIPSAQVTVDDTAGAQAGGLNTICVWSPVSLQDDAMPRLFGSAAAISAFHGYAPGVEYSGRHSEETGGNILFCGLPIATAGVVGRVDKSGNTGGSVATVSTSGAGVLHEHDGVLRVVTGGTVGTSQIVLEYSLDGGRKFRKVKIGQATTYTFPHVNVALSLTVGTLVAGDTIVTWHGTGPRSDSDGWQDAIANLAAQLKGFRSILLCGDLQNNTEAAAFCDQLNAYETAHKRFIYGRASLRDRLPMAEMSHDVARMTAGTSLTFDGTADTIERATGSWLADGFAVGDTVTFLSDDNDFTTIITVLTATLMSVTAAGVDADETTATATCVGYPTLTFVDVGAGSDTLTRNRGDWRSDGFRVGDLVTVDGTASNDDVIDGVLTGVSATVLTFGATAESDLDAEVISTNGVTVTAGETKAAWMATLDAAIDVDGEFRLDLSAGRARKLSPFSGWNFREPASWVASLREYQHDLHIPTWRKDDGPTGWDLNDDEGNLVEWDDRVDGMAASAARFTSLRTWGNGPSGTFVSLSLTREQEGSLLSLTHNVAVVNLACTVTQLNTENVVGRVLVLNDNGTATGDSLKTLEMQVNSALDLALLTNKEGEGPRASLAVWEAAVDDVLNVPDATINGVLTLNLNGTVFKVITKVKVLSGGQS